MDLDQEIYEAVGYVERSGFYPEAVKAIRAKLAEGQKPPTNTARDEIPACAQCKGFSQSCGFGSFRGSSGCQEARQVLSPVA